MIKKYYLACLLAGTFLLAAEPALAKVVLPSLIADNMILQQKQKVLLWGKARAHAEVIIMPSWNNKSYKAKTDAAGNWEIKLRTPQAGGPWTITFNDGEISSVNNVLTGEVWLCSGQSNMEMPLKGYQNQPVLNSDELIIDAANHPDIRIFRVPKEVSAEPVEDCNGHWFTAAPESAKDFSAVAYQYAKILNEKLKVPVGIIASYWGGTAVQSWMSKKNLGRFADVQLSERLDTITNLELHPEETPSILFNSMIFPLKNYIVKGFVWYQGESNRDHPKLYQQLFPAMVKEWRSLWKNSKLPFYYVQIAPYNYKGPNNYYTALLREAQLNASHQIPHSGMVVSLDAGKEKYIHPPDKTVISERLSYWALAKTYHYKNIVYRSPELKSSKIQNNKIVLTFRYADGGLISQNTELKNFEIAGQDKQFHPAKARITGTNTIEVQCPQVEAPLAVRYAFKNWAEADLFNPAGLPVSSFRTDDF